MMLVADALSCAVRLEDVHRTYGGGEAAVHALKGVSIALRRGTFTAVMGPSGSGKSTFLHCAAGLDRPTSGRVMLGDTELTGKSEAKLTELRRERVGFVFQSYNLLSELTVRQNVALPIRLGGPRTHTVDEVLAAVGLDGLGRRPVGELSGGQRQRVAVARALVTGPAVIFADEPTGALDPTTGGQILGLLRDAVDRDGVTVVMVTHDPAAAAWTDRVVLLRRGAVVSDGPSGDAPSIAGRLRAVAA
jgi:putative ABC transport system ATP-binding protein